MKKITMILLTLIGFTNLAHSSNENTINPWMVNAALGMTYYSSAMSHDGQVAMGRFSLGRSLFHLPFGQIDIEAGIQSGNTLLLDFPKEEINILGGVPIEIQVKPILDALIGFGTKPMGNAPINAWFKGGIAYRTLQADRESVNDINQFSPEIQVGVGYAINKCTSLNLGYQTILGKQPKLEINTQNETGSLHNIPLQQAVLLSVSYHFM
jgi:hypothetical protein